MKNCSCISIVKPLTSWMIYCFLIVTPLLAQEKQAQQHLNVPSQQKSYPPIPLSTAYWKDPQFLKSFNGTYRINARIEPSVTSEERTLLVSIQSMMAQGKREKALQTLSKSRFAHKSAAIDFNMGNLQFELGKIKDAILSYHRAIRRFPNFRRAHKNLGFCYARENRWNDAMKELEEAIRLGDQDGATYGQLAYGRMQQGHYASALQAYRLAQVTQPDSVDWKAGVAQCLQYLKRNEEALALIEEVIELRPDESSYYLLETSIQMALGQIDDAVANLDWLRRNDKLDAENHLLLASLHLRSGNNRLARPLVLKALTMSPLPSPHSSMNLLEFLIQMKDWSMATETLTAIENAYPKLAEEKSDELKNLSHKKQRLAAMIDIDSKTNPERGKTILETLLRENPLDAESMLVLARYHTSQKQLQEAEMLLQQATKVKSYRARAQIELAKLYVSQARYKEAIKQLDQSLKDTPNQSVKEYRDAVAHLAEAAE